jgi:hypothetical protein
VSGLETVALVLGGLLTVLCVLFVARPLLRPGKDEVSSAAGPAEDARVRLFERRDRALAALKELEFDHRTGKVSDEDYGAAVGPLRREAAEALKALESEQREEREEARVDVGR